MDNLLHLNCGLFLNHTAKTLKSMSIKGICLKLYIFSGEVCTFMLFLQNKYVHALLSTRQRGNTLMACKDACPLPAQCHIMVRKEFSQLGSLNHRFWPFADSNILRDFFFCRPLSGQTMLQWCKN